MGRFTIMTERGGTRHRYRQGHGRRRHGRGPKMNAFKGLMTKGLAFGKKHILNKLGKTYYWMPLKVVTLANHLNRIQGKWPSIH